MTDISTLVYIDATGYHYPDYPTLLSWVQSQYQTIYGADVYLAADSQDGQLLAIWAKALYDTAALGASAYNSFSPVTAQGLGLSRLVKINGLTRKIPSFSTVVLTIVGTAGTVISNGIAADVLGQKWTLPLTVTIPGGGTITVTATAALVGFINADVATVTTIFTPTGGWQTVNNIAAATPGAAIESDAALRLRQAVSVANPSLTVFQGTLGAVANVPGVTKVSNGYENPTGSTDVNGIPAHSISVVVAGGADADVAQAIQVHKTPGCGTAGDTDVLVYDSHGMPIHIKFARAVVATILVRITLSAGIGWTTDFETPIAAAVSAVVNAGNIGDTVLFTKLYAPAYLNGAPQGLTYTVATIELKKNAGAYAVANVALNYNEEAVCDPVTGVVFVVT